MRKTHAVAALGLLAATVGIARAEASPVEPPPADLVAGNTAFALDLHRALAKSGENLVFSPHSISTTVAMVRAGARGATLEQIDKTMHFPGDPSDGFRRLTEAIGNPPQVGPSKRKEAAYDLVQANALYVEKTFEPLMPFRTAIATSFGAEPRLVDFKRAADAARGEINDWVAKTTRDKIRDLFPAGSLTPLTRLVLANAVYFKAEWASKFPTHATDDQPFTTESGKDVTARTMHRKGRMGYVEKDDLQAVVLAYRAGETAMVVVLPRAKDGLHALEKSMDAARLVGLVGSAGPTEVRLSMPRWKSTSAVGLERPLAALGMRDAFVANDADFSGISKERPLWVQAAVHKAFVEVDETGTEAAAATGLAPGAASAPMEDRTVEVRVDHPFLFAIVHRTTGAVLFLGRVADPTRE